MNEYNIFYKKKLFEIFSKLKDLKKNFLLLPYLENANMGLEEFDNK